MIDLKAHLLQLPRKVKDPQTGKVTVHLEAYLPVRARVLAFREQYPHGSIETEFLKIDWDQGVAICRATAGDGEGGLATATGTETRADFEDFCERAETRAVGRCLGLLGFGTEYAMEMEELPHVVDRPIVTDAPIAPPARQRPVPSTQSSPQHPLHPCGMKPTLSRGANTLRCLM